MIKLERYIRKKLFDFMLWRTVKKLHISCILWDLRGLKRCEEHGFHAQSWITGKCSKCDKFNGVTKIEIYEVSEK